MKYSKGPQNSADPNDLEGYTALREGAAFVDRSDRRLLRLTGKDPIGMLNAVLTNDVPTHEDRGIYAMLLDPKGRIQTDLRVVKAGDEIKIRKANEEIIARVLNVPTSHNVSRRDANSLIEIVSRTELDPEMGV